MSYIDELRERFQAAEQRFGQISEASREYRERLMGLMSRIEEEIRCRRDVEQQQAKEIERLAGENEQLRTMMMSLLAAVESGDTDSLGNTLNEMDQKVSSLIGEGQGAAAPASLAAADAVEDAEMLGEYADEPSEGEAIAAPSFPAGDMMSMPAEEPSFSGEDVDLDQAEEPGTEAIILADETSVAEPAGGGELPVVEDDADISVVADDVVPDSDVSDAGEPVQAGLDRDVASEIADFFGADDQGGDDVVPAYTNAVAGWEDFLEDDAPATATAMPEPTPDAPVEVTIDAPQHEASDGSGADDGLFDEVAEDSTEPDAGSIHDLLDRAKTEIEGDDQDLDADNGGKTAAQ